MRDGRRSITPGVGDVVEIFDAAVVKTCLDLGWAEKAYQLVPTVASASIAPPAPGTSPAPVAPLPTNVSAEVKAWKDVPGISESSLATLLAKIPDVNPLTVTDEELEKALESKTRVTAVRTAITKLSAPAGADG